MSVSAFPDLSLEAWRPTLGTLQSYAQVLSAIRAAMAPREKHWWHISLQVSAAGLTTGPLPARDRVVELTLSLTEHRLYIATNRVDRAGIELKDQSAAAFCDAVLRALAHMGVNPSIDRKSFESTGAHTYDKAAVARFWQVLPLVDAALKRLKSEHRGESGAVQFWPHHFDIALLMFSGRRVSGTDPTDEESADENMNFGFLPGDEGIAQPYFYATAYPAPPGFADARLPPGAYWHTEGWTGAVLPYAVLRTLDHPLDRVLDFFRAAREAGFSRMK
jgi:hypothetical protein